MINEFYLDTSIWLDFYEKRGENGEKALKLIEGIIRENLTIYYSDLNIKELKDLGYSQEEIYEIFRIAKPDNIRKIHIYDKQIEEAEKIGKIRSVPIRDVLQAILCRDNFLELISRDKHFNQLRDITITKLPEDFIT